MKEIIRELFIDPPLAIARLGGSSIPQDAYRWISPPEPRADESTTIAPDWSLAVQQDGTVEPFLPTQLSFRDGELIRPVCPFFEIWARIGNPRSARRSWSEVPLTPKLLAQSGATLADLSLKIDAKNFKAARRTGNPNLRYGTFPPVQIRADTHLPVHILASSPNGVSQPMIPVDHPIPLGVVQIMKSRVPLPKDANASGVDVERLRFRLTPARGLIYGPPAAAQPSRTPRGGVAVPVEKSNAFLNPAAGWAGATGADNALIEPGDTFDGADVGAEISLGVIDDTCEVRFELQLALSGKPALSASAHAFVGPPDFAPDRRPFLSLADELNDRGAGSQARSRSMTAAQRDQWIQDLFARVFETTTLFNVDFYRIRNAAPLSGKQLAKVPVKDDQLPLPSRAMGRRDALRIRKGEPAMLAPSRDVPLPLSQRATARHLELSDLSTLRQFIEENKERIKKLVRRPFDIKPGEDINGTSMQMPPFMRNSNAEPLTLSTWQYDLLMSWVAEQESRPKGKKPPDTAFAAAAKKRRKQVLDRRAAVNKS